MSGVQVGSRTAGLIGRAIEEGDRTIRESRAEPLTSDSYQHPMDLKGGTFEPGGKMLVLSPEPSSSTDTDFGTALIEQAASLSAYARRLAGHGSDADDLLQDTMLRCWAARERFRAGTNLAAWMRTVMRNSFLSGRRRARFHTDLPDDARDQLMWVEENQSHAVTLKDASWALNELAPDQRDAVSLASQGLSIEEGASRLGIAEGTFKSRLSRGRARLRALLEERSTPLLADKSDPGEASNIPHERTRRKRDWRGVMIG